MDVGWLINQKSIRHGRGKSRAGFCAHVGRTVTLFQRFSRSSLVRVDSGALPRRRFGQFAANPGGLRKKVKALGRNIVFRNETLLRRSSARLIPSAPEEDPVNTGAARTRTAGPQGYLPIAISEKARETSVELLNQLLADTMALRDLYKKHHWQAAGRWFYQMHLLFDKHYQEQAELADEVAERIRILGGISVAMPHDVAQRTQIRRPPMGRESTVQQIQRLLQAHEIILLQSHGPVKQAEEHGDDGTVDLIVSSVIRTNEMQAWFIGQHLANESDEANSGSR